MLTWIHPKGLRVTVRFTLSLLASIGGLAVLAGIIYLISQYAASSKQHVTLVENILGAIFIMVFLIVMIRLWMRRQRRELATVMYRRGNELVRQQRYEEAQASYGQAIKAVPKFPYAWNGRGACLGRLGRFQEALAAFENVVVLSPLYVRAWTNKGAILVRLKRYDEALADFDHALAIDSTDSPAWNNKAALLFGPLKRYDDALVVCDAAIAQGIATADIWASKGNALRALGREAEAHTAYEQTLTFPAADPRNSEARGDALASIGQYKDALTAYELALITWPPDRPDVLRRKADVLRALGRDDEAREAEARAGELDG